jgi:hypothetical protein
VKFQLLWVNNLQWLKGNVCVIINNYEVVLSSAIKRECEQQWALSEKLWVLNEGVWMWASTSMLWLWAWVSTLWTWAWVFALWTFASTLWTWVFVSMIEHECLHLCLRLNMSVYVYVYIVNMSVCICIVNMHNLRSLWTTTREHDWCRRFVNNHEKVQTIWLWVTMNIKWAWTIVNDCERQTSINDYEQLWAWMIVSVKQA